MSTTNLKPLVLVIGGAGNIGLVIIKALAETGAWNLAVSVRPSSASKPEVSILRDLGVEVRSSDWQTDSLEKLEELCAGVEVLISTVHASTTLGQVKLADAAKRANVRRFIPCDFSPAGIPGTMDLYDQKLSIRKYVIQSGVPYTFIDVGFWMQITVPPRVGTEGPSANRLREWYGEGNQKTAVVNLSSIGGFVARIIADPRTLNQYVFMCDDEVTMTEVYSIVSQISGEDLHKVKVEVSEEEVVRRAAEGKAEYQKSPSLSARAKWAINEYTHSIYFAGKNTSETAKSQGALIGKELYPDYKFQSMAEYVKGLYGANQ